MREVRKLIIGDMKAIKAKGSKEEEEEKLQGETVHWLRWIGLPFRVMITVVATIS